jgi:Designed helical repeat protein 10 domain
LQRAELLQALEEVNQEQKQLQEEWKKSEIEAAAKSEQMALMMEECHDLEQEIARNNKLQAAARKEAALLKRQANDLKNELATAACESKESMAEIEGLKKLVVSSPERRQKQLAESKLRNEAEKENLATLETESRDISTSLRHTDEAGKDLQIVTASLQELQAEAHKQEELSRNLQAAKERVFAAQARQQELDEQTIETERSLQRAEEKQLTQQKQHQMQMEACHEALEAAKHQMLQGEQERRSGVQRIHDAQEKVLAMQADLEQERVHMRHELQTTIAEYKQVAEKFMQRDHRRLQALTEASTTCD